MDPDMAILDPLRHHKRLSVSHGAFGSDSFGKFAERLARFLGTPKFIIGQTLFVITWMLLTGLLLPHLLHIRPWDPYPWILLNLLFSTQAAYASPFILLAATRQADRDKASEEANAHHRDELARSQSDQLSANTELTQDIHDLQLQQMTILGSVRDVHGDVAALTAALVAKGIIDGGPGEDKGIDSGAGGGERGPGPVDVGGAPGLSEPPDVPGGPGQPHS